MSDDPFKVHRLNEGGLAKAEQAATILRNALADLKALMVPTVPAGYVANTSFAMREQALVVTKLQEASFFAKRAIALDPQNQFDYTPHRWVVDEDKTYCRNRGCTTDTGGMFSTCDGEQPAVAP